jgi:hypothetical protein
MAEIGIALPLSYFNLFEVGQNVEWPLPAVPPGCEKDVLTRRETSLAGALTPEMCWNDSSVLIASQLADAVYIGSSAKKVPSYSWQNAILLDPGVVSYRSFLANQAKLHTTLLGKAFKGVVVDRTDHTTLFSFGRDDGLAWCGTPCASMLLAWDGAAAEVAAAIHGAKGDSLVLINYSGGGRVELLRHADGIFSEGGSAILNSIGLSTFGTIRYYPALPTLPNSRPSPHLSSSQLTPFSAPLLFPTHALLRTSPLPTSRPSPHPSLTAQGCLRSRGHMTTKT